MTHYIALIHKEPKSSYGVSFPDIPGVVTAGESLDEAMHQAAEVLTFAAEDWDKFSLTRFPKPRSIDELRSDPEFVTESAGAIVAAVPLKAKVEAAA